MIQKTKLMRRGAGGAAKRASMPLGMAGMPPALGGGEGGGDAPAGRLADQVELIDLDDELGEDDNGAGARRSRSRSRSRSRRRRCLVRHDATTQALSSDVSHERLSSDVSHRRDLCARALVGGSVGVCRRRAAAGGREDLAASQPAPA
jgi:hypothetical protein